MHTLKSEDNLWESVLSLSVSIGTSGPQAWQQLPLPAQPSCYPVNFSVAKCILVNIFYLLHMYGITGYAHVKADVYQIVTSVAVLIYISLTVYRSSCFPHARKVYF